MRRDLCALALAAREAEITLGYLRHEARDDNPGADARREATRALPEAERACRYRLLELADAVEDGLAGLGEPALAAEGVALSDPAPLPLVRATAVRVLPRPGEAGAEKVAGLYTMGDSERKGSVGVGANYDSSVKEG
jgi:hypothetical protein